MLKLENRLQELRLSDCNPTLSPNVQTYDLIISPTNLGKFETRQIYLSVKDDNSIKQKTYCEAIQKLRGNTKQWPIIDLILNIEMAKALSIFQELEVFDKV